MLENLNDLKDYTRQVGDMLPDLKSEIVLKSPGISQSDATRLKSALPDLPDSYLKCIQLLDVQGISIGYFRLWPSAARTSALVESLIQINRPEQNPRSSFFQKSNLYEVAAWEAEPICVASNNSPHAAGAVFKISIVHPSPKVELLANNFETFLLLAGNLDAICHEYSQTENSESANAKFEHCLAHFALPAEAIATWKDISDVVLSD